MYETMVYWETAVSASDRPDAARDFAEIWRMAEKVVYSRTLRAVSSARTRIERELDARAISELKQGSPSDITIGGAELAGQALAAQLVDELGLFLTPILIGAGKPALPDGLRADLELTGERRFDNGVVYLQYRLPCGGGSAHPAT